METRASYVLVGAFVVSLIVAGVIFVMWLAGDRGKADSIRLAVHFRSDVTGLSVDAPVRYRGIPVGKVKKIRISPKDPNVAEVIIQVGPDTPIFRDLEGRMESAGLTGSPFIQLVRPRESGIHTNKRLKASYLRERENPLVIKGSPSELQSVIQELRDTTSDIRKMVAQGTTLLTRVTLLFDETNRKRVANILKSTDLAAANLKDLSKEAKLTATEFRTALTSLNPAFKAVGPAIKRLNKAIGDVQGSAKAFAKMSGEVAGLVRENRRPLRSFFSTGLHNVSQFFTEARKFVAATERLVRRIENDPSRFIFGRQRGFKPGRRR
jgi:phospholipid/cholesterol/gamma-HCH transport system substrate-binding protein